MLPETANQGLLKMLFEQPDAYKFLTGIFVLFVVPQIINIANTVNKNKGVKAFNNGVTSTLNTLIHDIQILKDRINQMYNDTCEECNPAQIEAVYRGRVSIDIELLIKNTKQVILINHIENKEVTKRKVINNCKTVVGNTRIILNHFKRNGVACGTLINENEWVEVVANTVLAFIYNESNDCCDKPHYNYEALRLNIKSLCDTFTIEFINKINNENNNHI